MILVYKYIMEVCCLKEIPFEVDREQLLKKLRMKKDSEYGPLALELADEAEKIGKPKAIYSISHIEEKKDYSIVVEGVELSSRIIRKNTGHANRLFPYAATCGTELEGWANEKSDSLEYYVADILKGMGRRAAVAYLFKIIDEKYGLINPSYLPPGSLKDWPILEQQNLFRLFDNKQHDIGVELMESSLMVPVETVSGIRFSS